MHKCDALPLIDERKATPWPQHSKVCIMMVVAPPSHHNSGHKYKWVVMPISIARALGNIDLHYEGPVAEFAPMPEWLLEEVVE